MKALVIGALLVRILQARPQLLDELLAAQPTAGPEDPLAVAPASAPDALSASPPALDADPLAAPSASAVPVVLVDPAAAVSESAIPVVVVDTLASSTQTPLLDSPVASPEVVPVEPASETPAFDPLAAPLEATTPVPEGDALPTPFQPLFDPLPSASDAVATPDLLNPELEPSTPVAALDPVATASEPLAVLDPLATASELLSAFDPLGTPSDPLFTSDPMAMSPEPSVILSPLATASQSFAAFEPLATASEFTASIASLTTASAFVDPLAGIRPLDASSLPATEVTVIATPVPIEDLLATSSIQSLGGFTFPGPASTPIARGSGPLAVALSGTFSEGFPASDTASSTPLVASFLDLNAPPTIGLPSLASSPVQRGPTSSAVQRGPQPFFAAESSAAALDQAGLGASPAFSTQAGFPALDAVPTASIETGFPAFEAITAVPSLESTPIVRGPVSAAIPSSLAVLAAEPPSAASLFGTNDIIFSSPEPEPSIISAGQDGVPFGGFGAITTPAEALDTAFVSASTSVQFPPASSVRFPRVSTSTIDPALILVDPFAPAPSVEIILPPQPGSWSPPFTEPGPPAPANGANFGGLAVGNEVTPAGSNGAPAGGQELPAVLALNGAYPLNTSTSGQAPPIGPPGWEGEDVGDYEGEDWDYGWNRRGNSYDCRKWCRNRASYSRKKKQRQSSSYAIAGRQVEPPSSGGFKAFDWPQKSEPSQGQVFAYETPAPYPYDSPQYQSTDYADNYDEDLPEWLKALRQEKLRRLRSRVKSRCAKKCRSYTKTCTICKATSTPSSYDDIRLPYVASTSAASSSVESAIPYSVVDMATPLASTLVTSTTSPLAEEIVSNAAPAGGRISNPAPTGGSDGNAAAPDALAQTCPSTCNPFNPAENQCDAATTGCATTGGAHYYCTCRAGYRFDGVVPSDFSLQFKAPGQPYVYGPPNRSCNTRCSDDLCSEVPVRPACA